MRSGPSPVKSRCPRPTKPVTVVKCGRVAPPRASGWQAMRLAPSLGEGWRSETPQIAKNRTRLGTMLAAAATAVIIFVPVCANAMPIRDFDKLPRDDQRVYLVALMSRTEDYLIEHHLTAEQRSLDNAIGSEAAFAKSYDRLSFYIEMARSVARGGATKNVVEVEHAWLMWLREVGIVIPKSAGMRLMDGFDMARERASLGLR